MNLFKTNNTNLAAFLMAKGFSLHGSQSEDGIQFFYIDREEFETNSKILDNLVSDYTLDKKSPELLVSVKKLEDARRTLIHNIKNNQ